MSLKSSIIALSLPTDGTTSSHPPHVGLLMKSSASHVGSPLTHRPIAMAVVTLAGTYLALDTRAIASVMTLLVKPLYRLGGAAPAKL
jgi:hypothetical protein